MKTYTCDSGHDVSTPCRVLPTGGTGNAILCHKHYTEEMAFRRSCIAEGRAFELPKWEDLKVYEEC